MTRASGIISIALLSLLFVSVAATDFDSCIKDFRANSTEPGGVDYDGKGVIRNQSVGLTYEACKTWCKTGPEPFDWSVFSQQFSAWLLPWLALVSQLPFGAENRLDNLISVVLTVGSPTLAAFSLALTAINTRWAYNRFSAIEYPNRKYAAKALVYLQQVPLRLTTRDGLLASLILLPENDDWWECLVDRLEQTHTWTVAAATSIAWVILAFIFTIVDSFMNLGKNLNSNGQGVGTVWLWLIPIVVGWLWIPVCSYDKLKTAIDKANGLAFVAARGDLPQIDGLPNVDAPSRVRDVSHMQAVRIHKRKKVFTKDAARAGPVFNYSRAWEWSSDVETIARAFEQAYRKARRREPVDSRKDWVYPEDKHPNNRRDNRTGTVAQVQAYCGFPLQEDEEPARPVPSGIWKRIFIASVFALGLQWGTTASAAITVIFTPAIGLGCRSGAYILYGTVSTMIWLALLLSSYLAHYAKVLRDEGGTQDRRFNSANLAKGLATLLRRLSVFAATCSTLGITLSCILQFSKFYSTCYCNSSVLGRGAKRAYIIIDVGGLDNSQLKGGWIGAVVLSGGCAALFLFFIHLMLEPSDDAKNR